MIKTFILFFIWFFNISFALAEIDVNKCDTIKDKVKKITCLTQLKATAISQNAKEKVKPIDRKLKNTHKKIGSTVSRAEKGVTTTFKENMDKLNNNNLFQKIRNKNKEMNEKAN